jgi:hypothetical protein
VSPPPKRRPVDWRRRVTAAFTEHLPLKASALLLTVAMWFVVGAREPTEEVVSVQFAPLLDSALALRDPAPAIRALVIGRPSEIIKLSSSPLVIRRPIVTGEPDTLVLTLRTNDVEVPEGVEVIVRDVQPRSLTLRFESTSSRRVPVKSALVQRPPYLIASSGAAPVRLEPESVTVRGPRVAVARVRFVPTVRDSITISDTLPHLVDLDTTGLGVSVKPPQVKATFVRIPALKRGIELPRR